MKRFFLAIAAEITSAEGGPREGREGNLKALASQAESAAARSPTHDRGCDHATAALDRRSLKKP